VILPIVLGLTFVWAALAPLMASWWGRRAGWPLAAGLVALAVPLAAGGGADATVELPWLPTLDVALRLRLDGLSMLFAMLVLLVGALVIAYSASYLHRSDPGFYGLMTLFAAAMLGLVLADDVLVLFVMWELTTLCSFFLIARSGPGAGPPAIRTLLITMGGGLSLLAGVVLAAVHAGTTELSAILADPFWTADPLAAAAVALLVAVAAFTKSAQFPFHSWLPDAMVAPTPVSAYLHAAAMVKAGIYLLLRFSEALAATPTWNVVVITVGLVTAVMGALFALQRHDLKELLAYSTVSQLGFLVAAIGVGTPEAMVAGAVHTVAHALFKGALFMLVGVVDHQTGTRDIGGLSGLARTMPVTATALALAAASMAGVPPLLGFLSKENVLAALLEAPGPSWTGPVAAGVGTAAAMLTVAYCGRIVLGCLPGRPRPETAREAPAAFVGPPALLAGLGLVLGPAAILLDPAISAAASAAGGVAVEADLALWHGLATELLLSALALGGGVLLIAGRVRVGRALARDLLPITGVGVTEAIRTGVTALGVRVVALTRSDAPTRHLLMPVLGLLVLAAAGFATGGLPAPDPRLVRPVDWLLTLVVLAGVGGLVAVRRRLAGLVLVGVVGFAVTVWFFVLGAADVALTQLLVEILTVVVLALVLSRLPERFRAGSRRRNMGAGVIAVAAGLASTFAVLALTGRPELSAVGRYFLAEAPADTGGSNVVNTILVDYRALDTLGELTVLGVAAVVIVVALDSRGLLPRKPPPLTVRPGSPLLDPHENAVFGRTLARAVGPILVVLSMWLLLRGHYEPGGGFISGLVGGGGLALLFLTAPSESTARIRLPALALAGAGVAIAVLTGLLGLADGTFLSPQRGYVLGQSLTTALVFDVGVYLVVVGMVLTALNRLGPTGARGDPAGDPVPHRSSSTAAAERGSGNGWSRQAGGPVTTRTEEEV
jgi:multicomponent Na+:H+ antiporter subunit A